MAQMQNMFDFPPAPKLDVPGRLDPGAGHRERAARRDAVLRQGASARAATRRPLYLDHQMHDLQLERFIDEPRRRTDQDLHAARHQGQPAVPA